MPQLFAASVRLRSSGTGVSARILRDASRGISAAENAVRVTSTAIPILVA
jgi:hypothetical protein